MDWIQCLVVAICCHIPLFLQIEGIFYESITELIVDVHANFLSIILYMLWFSLYMIIDLPMNHTCLGAGVVLAEKLNLYPCFLGLIFFIFLFQRNRNPIETIWSFIWLEFFIYYVKCTHVFFTEFVLRIVLVINHVCLVAGIVFLSVAASIAASDTKGENVNKYCEAFTAIF
ncbi:hypothetical protein ACJX0J_026669, partial [Zea mays]